MAVDITNISRVRGDTSAFTVTITTDGTTPLDITGYSFVFTVDPSSEPSDATGNLFELSSPASGIALTTPAEGLITLTMSSGDADQTPGTYYYDLQMTDGGGLITTVLKGAYEVIQDISK